MKFRKNYAAIFQTFWIKFLDKIFCVECPKWKNFACSKNNERNLMLEKICQFKKI